MFTVGFFMALPCLEVRFYLPFYFQHMQWRPDMHAQSSTLLHLQILCHTIDYQIHLPVDPGVMNRPIRFKLTARTDDPKILRTMQIHWSSPIVNKRKVLAFSMVHCGLHALEVTNLNLVANNLLRICFKG